MSNSTTLPVVPLHQPLILFPACRLTLPVSRTIGEHIRSLLSSSETYPVIAAVPLPAVSSPTQLCYNGWGVAARVLRLVKPSSRNVRQPYALSLHGLMRIQLCTPLPVAPSSQHSLTSLVDHPVTYPPPADFPSPAAIEAFKASALRLLDRLAKDSSPASRREDWMKIAVMLEDLTDERVGWLADVMVSAINGEYADKLAYLNAQEITPRLLVASSIFQKQTALSEITTRISQSVNESLSKQQKEFFLRQQLAAIQRELSTLRSSSAILPNSSAKHSSTHTFGAKSPEATGGNELDDDDAAESSDLLDIRSKVECMEQGSEERKMGVREWRRLKRIPAGSVENGVVKNYLEWLTSLPWPNMSALQRETTDAGVETVGRKMNTSVYLSTARTQLDADHFGLEKIKRRLIEYLAIVRLREINAAREAASAASAEADKGNEGKQNKEPKKLDIVKKLTGRAQNGENEEKQLGKVEVAGTGRRIKGAKGPILLFVGPPGVGKTSLGQSVAKALQRPFQRISLGGVRDEAEIRGHRRTYVASGPGLIIQALRRAGRNDPVLLLDEIDKVGQSNFHGDPAAALLEVLDPEQNHTFHDHYINVPFDLSQVLFICTANTLDTVSAPLLDRCEVIQLSGYTHDEKIHIARRFLLPKQLQANGLAPAHVSITEPALLQIATQYTREAGVRSLERAIGGVVRFKAVEWAEYADDEAKDVKEYNRVVDEHDLEKILGISRWDGEDRDREERRGVVYGLVVTGQGEGGILPVESIAVPGSGLLKLTGSLGDVIKESGQLALTWIKTNAYDLCITDTSDQDPLMVPNPFDIHLHLPAGAQKKDGPSAGIAMICAFVSLLTGACVPANVAMTGEVTLRGRVTPVGGIKEKILGAHRAQITKVILPWANRKDVDHDIAPVVKNDMEFIFVRTVREALDAAFGKDALMWRRNSSLFESRL